jgi:hypothetical protein
MVATMRDDDAVARRRVVALAARRRVEENDSDGEERTNRLLRAAVARERAERDAAVAIGDEAFDEMLSVSVVGAAVRQT